MQVFKVGDYVQWESEVQATVAPVKIDAKVKPPMSIEQKQLLNQELVISIPRKFRVNVDVRGDELKREDLARIKSQFTRWIEGLEEAFE